MNINRRSRGQSLLELVLVLPLFITFWAAMVWFARVFIIKIELMHTARHGIFWLAYNPNSMTSDEERRAVQSECLDFLNHQDASIAKSGPLTITVTPGDRWRSSGPAELTELEQFFSLTTRLLKDSAGFVHFDPASVTLDYAMASPPLLRAIPGFPSTIPLRGYCVCYR